LFWWRLPTNSKNIQKKIISIHKPPASIRFALIKHALSVTVEPFKFSPAKPVAYELSCQINTAKDQIGASGIEIP
jgi:hypothetical protein